MAYMNKGHDPYPYHAGDYCGNHLVGGVVLQRSGQSQKEAEYEEKQYLLRMRFGVPHSCLSGTSEEMMAKGYVGLYLKEDDRWINISSNCYLIDTPEKLLEPKGIAMKTFKVGDLVRTLIEFRKIPVGYIETITRICHYGDRSCVDYCLRGFPDVWFEEHELELVTTKEVTRTHAVGDVVRTLIGLCEVPCGYTESITNVFGNNVNEQHHGCYALQGFPEVFFTSLELELVETKLSPTIWREPDYNERVKTARNDWLNRVFN